MRVLLDHCVDNRFAKLLTGHEARHAKAMGWANFSNGNLLDAAEVDGLAVMVTVDKSVRFQQNLARRKISLITINPRLVDYERIAPLAAHLTPTRDAGFPPGSEITIEP